MLFYVWLLWLAHLLPMALGGGLAGALEKIFADDCYEIFQIAFDKEDQADNDKKKSKKAKGTPSTGQDIMFKKGKSKGAQNSGWGTGPYEGYSFAEFMDEISNFQKGRCTVAPSSGSKLLEPPAHIITRKIQLTALKPAAISW